MPLVLRAQTLWDELEKASGEKIFAKTGVLSFSPEDHAAFLNEAVESANTYNLPIETMAGVEVEKRWPAFRFPRATVPFMNRMPASCFRKTASAPAVNWRKQRVRACLPIPRLQI